MISSNVVDYEFAVRFVLHVIRTRHVIREARLTLLKWNVKWNEKPGCVPSEHVMCSWLMEFADECEILVVVTFVSMKNRPQCIIHQSFRLTH